jgi:hypothetical protein
MASPTSGDRDYLMGEMESARNQLLASYEGLSDEQMTRLGAVGEWSVKDVLSHVASWDEVLLPDLARISSGDTPSLASIDLETANFDNANAAIMSQRRSVPLDQVLRGLDTVRADVVAAVARLPDSALVEGRFARPLLQITAAHDREHAEAILQWRKQQGL